MAMGFEHFSFFNVYKNLNFWLLFSMFIVYICCLVAINLYSYVIIIYY